MANSPELDLIIERCKAGKMPSINKIKELSFEERAIAMQHVKDLGDRNMIEFDKIINKEE